MLNRSLKFNKEFKEFLFNFKDLFNMLPSISIFFLILYLHAPSLLERSFNASYEFRKDDAVVAFSGVARNRHGRHLAWAFLRGEWPRIFA